jgi:secreted trypsin-like serine protease
VLFAAHCVESKKSIDTVQAELSYFVFRDNWDEDGTQYHISEIIVHQDWDTLTKPYEADIAIAILKEPVEFSSNVTNICLNSPSKAVDDNFIGRNASVAGWGYTKSSGNKTVNELRAVTVPIVERDKCTSRHLCERSIRKNYFVLETLNRRLVHAEVKKGNFNFIQAFSFLNYR